MKEADLLRDQQRALAVQREEEVKIRKQQEMLEIEASQQREHQATRYASKMVEGWNSLYKGNGQQDR